MIKKIILTAALVKRTLVVDFSLFLSAVEISGTIVTENITRRVVIRQVTAVTIMGAIAPEIDLVG